MLFFENGICLEDYEQNMVKKVCNIEKEGTECIPFCQQRERSALRNVNERKVMGAMEIAK